MIKGDSHAGRDAPRHFAPDFANILDVGINEIADIRAEAAINHHASSGDVAHANGYGPPRVAKTNDGAEENAFSQGIAALRGFTHILITQIGHILSDIRKLFATRKQPVSFKIIRRERLFPAAHAVPGLRPSLSQSGALPICRAKLALR
jgi:hypothetical protein